MMKLTVVLVAVVMAGAGSGADLWDDRPADGNWQQSWFPLGNGALGAMLSGGTDHFAVQLNVDSLWTGAKNATATVSDEDSDPTGATMRQERVWH